ncbi:platelet-activating factor acetylhydrolase-like [Macrosteles quadrilineatus]|uniref:platelet-activating factor acetylhydrolase-like n=1 Tax=Macrosteles quadrilineatus TaxID=74068 RepID=UPI0023E1CEBD|nr:platelet-activating factor acetylhydrolase-like [Macrosteles quadrilineatus]
MGILTKKKFLPEASGPYATSCADLMTEYSQYGVFIRLYYPTSKASTGTEGWFRWVPHDMYTQGLACVVSLWVFILRLVMWWYGGEMYVPAQWEAPLLPASHSERKEKLPVIIFSHGFGAARYFCSAMLLELASQGYVVASLEHRDTSACATYFYKSAAHRDKDERTWIPHAKLEIGPQHYELRRKQVRCRRDECVKSLDFLEDINSGNTNKNILKTSLDLQGFKDQLDLDSVTVMGHSFGGSTALLTLASDTRFKQGVILDGWMFPLKEEDVVVPQPLLLINTPTFHIASNISVMTDQIINRPAEARRQLYIIRTSNHETQTDAPFVFGYWLDLFKPKIDPYLGTTINNYLIIKYLQPMTGIPSGAEQIDQELKKHQELIIEGRLPDPVRPRKGMSLLS